MTLIDLEEAKMIKEDVTKNDILAIEVAIRELTNNNFYRTLNGKPSVRIRNITIEDGWINVNSDSPASSLMGIREKDRLELGGSRYNPELLTVKTVDKDAGKIEIEEADELLDEDTKGLFITLVQYPVDVKMGALEILNYKEKMKGAAGLKSISISRVKHTYYDIDTDNAVEGVPASVFSFIDKYRKISWGV